MNRVFAIARAHDRLYDEGGIPEISPEDYLEDILRVYSMSEETAPRLETEIRSQGNRIHADAAIPLA
jgi:two-component sensor histidine kinase